jgi:hypothetical protein
MTYSGWANYPTWCVHLWITNDEQLYHDTRALLQRAGASRHAQQDALKSYVRDELAPDLGASFAADLLGYALDQVDWDEITTALTEDE